MSEIVFKSFGAKGFAKGAARKLCEAAGLQVNDELIVQEDGKWGFYLHVEDNVPVGKPLTEQQECDEAREAFPEGSDEVSANAFGAMGTVANPFGGMIGQITGERTQAPVVRSSTSGYKIEKDREERNGIRKPSAGTTCRAIWDELDNLSADLPGNQVVPIKQWKARASELGFDPTTTTIQYYKWRNFQGVVGRQS